MCARRINQADNRQREFFGVAHHAHGFAVAFGVRHPEIAAHIFFGVVALLVADNHHTVFRHPPNATHQRLVIRLAAVAVQLEKIIAQHFHIIQRVRALRMAGDLHFIPRS